MALSEQEQRMLAEIEKALLADDPRLGKQASAHGQQGGMSWNLRSIALLMLGLCLLIGGIAMAQLSLWFVAASVLGFVVMFFGGLLAFRGEASSQMRGGIAKQGVTLGASSAKPRKATGGLGDKMEDSFKRRFER